LLWKQQCNIYDQDPGKLEWVFRTTIRNEVAKELIFNAIGGKDQQSVWPGRSFPTTTNTVRKP